MINVAIIWYRLRIWLLERKRDRICHRNGKLIKKCAIVDEEINDLNKIYLGVVKIELDLEEEVKRGEEVTMEEAVQMTINNGKRKPKVVTALENLLTQSL